MFFVQYFQHSAKKDMRKTASKYFKVLKPIWLGVKASKASVILIYSEMFKFLKKKKTTTKQNKVKRKPFRNARKLGEKKIPSRL